MAEKLSHHEHSPEKQNHHGHSPEHERAAKEAIEKGKHAEHEAQKSIESIKHSIEHQALSGKEYTVGENQNGQKETSHYGLSKSVKKASYKKTMSHTRKQLSVPERGLSKVIHQPVVDAVSTVAGKTVARPSGVLIGGIGALAGSIFLYVMGRRYGFSYNFLVYALLFCVCYIFGVIGEFLFRLATKLRSR